MPGAPVALQVPEVSKGGSDALAGNSSSSSSSSSSSQSSQDSGDAAATATATPTASGQSGTSGTTQSGSTGGTSGTAQQTQQSTGTNGQSQGERQHVRQLLQEQPRRLLSAERGSLRDPPPPGQERRLARAAGPSPRSRRVERPNARVVENTVVAMVFSSHPDL